MLQPQVLCLAELIYSWQGDYRVCFPIALWFLKGCASEFWHFRIWHSRIDLTEEAEAGEHVLLGTSVWTPRCSPWRHQSGCVLFGETSQMEHHQNGLSLSNQLGAALLGWGGMKWVGMGLDVSTHCCVWVWLFVLSTVSIPKYAKLQVLPSAFLTVWHVAVTTHSLDHRCLMRPHQIF